MNRSSLVKWDKDAIVKALLDRQAQGLELNTGAIQKQHNSLSAAIYSHFPSHDAALLAAGIDPASVRKRVQWDRARVVAALQARVAAGLAVNLAAVARDERRLSGAIDRYFGSHDQALRAAGIDPRSARPARPVKWSHAAVVAALTERRDQRLGLNQRAVEQSNPGLSWAAKRCFGSHDAALRAAAVRKYAQWDKDKITKAIRSRRRRGLGLSCSAVAKSSGPLSSAMTTYFGSHEAALQAAGIDPASVRQRGPRWDQARVIAALRDRHERGLPLNSKAIQRSYPSLDAASRKLFPSYDAAIQAAGIDPASTRMGGPTMPKHEVIAVQQQRQNAGLGLNVRAVHGSDARLAYAMRRGFGSHDDALRAAGIDPLSVRKRLPMTGEQIRAALQGLARNGLVARPWVESAHPRLRDQARSRFGSLQAAVEAAGLQYVPRCAGSDDAGHWTEQGVLKMLRDLHREGHDLRYRRMKEKSQPLFFAAKRLFGSYVNAVKEAGIDYWEMSQAQLANDRAAAAAGNARAEADG